MGDIESLTRLQRCQGDATLIEFYNDRGYDFERDQLIAEFLPGSGSEP